MRVVIVGAGLAGLVAANELTEAGAEVSVLDKGRSVGGRLATRRMGGARLDHGAQFFTARTPAFQRRIDDWIERGVVHVWHRGFDGDDGHPRFVASRGMNSLAKDLAASLDDTTCRIETSTMAFAVRPGTGGRARWSVAIDDGTHRDADAVVLTAPLAQTFSLLVDTAWNDDDPEAPHGIELDETLFRTEYDRTIGLLATVDGPTAVPEPGGVQHGDDVFSFIGDNRSKGVSDEPAITFHANPTWSEEHWDDDPDDLLQLLEAAAAPWLGGAHIVERQLKKWRFATPRSIWPDPCWTTAGGTIIVAGDAFAGPRVEGAHNSGLAAAGSLLA